MIRNVIYIHTHDMGRFISPYGYSVPTPHLQKFACGATTFRKAFCCGPTCSPSRAGLLTGVSPHESGLIGLAHCGFSLADPEQHLAAYLKKNGFLTALCGIQHEFHPPSAPLPYAHVVDQWQPGGCRQTDAAWTRAAVRFLDDKPSGPFFLSFGLFHPHRPFEPSDPREFPPDFVQPPAHLPDTPEIRQDTADYHYSMHLADACIGEVLESIRRNGFEKNTLIVITTDHGPAFPGMKCQLTDAGIGVTLMMDYPGNGLRGSAHDALVSHLDVFPTICDLLDLPAPSWLRGKSLRPLFERRADAVRAEIFSEVTFHAAYEPMRCIRTERYKLIRRFDFSSRRPSNCDPSPSRKVLIDGGWLRSRLAEWEFYDLLLDPQETTNLADSCDHLSIRNGLESRLNDWMSATRDPLLLGEVKPPKGSRVCLEGALDFSNGPFLDTS